MLSVSWLSAVWFVSKSETFSVFVFPGNHLGLRLCGWLSFHPYKRNHIYFRDNYVWYDAFFFILNGFRQRNKLLSIISTEEDCEMQLKDLEKDRKWTLSEDFFVKITVSRVRNELSCSPVLMFRSILVVDGKSDHSFVW